MFIRSRSKHVTNRVRPIECMCVWSYGEERIVLGFEMWKGSTISAMAGVGGTDLPGTSVFGNGCGTCSPKRWSPCASKRWSPTANGVVTAHEVGTGFSAPVVRGWALSPEARKEGRAFRKEEQKETQQEWDALCVFLVHRVLPTRRLTFPSHLL